MICLEFNNNNRATAVTVAESEEDMIKLIKILDLLELDAWIEIYEGESKLYCGMVGKCTKDIWKNAHIKSMKFNNYKERYFINVRYM